MGCRDPMAGLHQLGAQAVAQEFVVFNNEQTGHGASIPEARRAALRRRAVACSLHRRNPGLMNDFTNLFVASPRQQCVISYLFCSLSLIHI